ncbi:hypothetical protein H7J88_25765 [Mycolicibacterium flavescens]|uniref:Uncharacterized protein n=1 Tax=Mycolicibacterium flavescens TaxID=1776 RepID=A0A1E3RCB4_MYCFV|nr:hypothetical protein [Mycolicibacterium flavescens]MCV7283047.1 hypothetical protein [Mycolicibacterium flavescens]ODQ87524.1 hypothetical protein BHQ18_23220 [Mycolicibacterium flavescens]
MSIATVVTTTLVPFASVVSTATVAIWTKRLDTRSKREERMHALVLDYERRAGEDKKAALKTLISATLHVKRGAELRAGAEVTEETTAQRRIDALRELYEFRARLGLDDGIAELMIYASAPVRELTDLVLDEWDRQFREHGYSMTQLDACKRQLLKTAAETPADDSAILSGEEKWCALKEEEHLWLKRLGDGSDLDVDALLDLCNRVLKAAHMDLRGGYGIATE